MLESGNQNVLAWSRTAASREMVVVACNFSSEPQVVSLATALGGSGKTAKTLAASGGADQKGTIRLDAVSLPPYGSIVAEVK